MDKRSDSFNGIYFQRRKVVLLGDAFVGKSTLLERFISNRVNPDPQATVGGLEYKHSYYLNSSGRELELELWDIAGGESFRNMTSLYFRDADAAILVFDVTDRASFESLKSHWLKDLREKGRDQIIVAVVGNKMDLDEEQGQVKEEEARNI